MTAEQVRSLLENRQPVEKYKSVSIFSICGKFYFGVYPRYTKHESLEAAKNTIDFLCKQEYKAIK